MSSDNGIYVLVTKSGEAKEYRVVIANAIENIYEWDRVARCYTDRADVVYMCAYFGKSKPFTDKVAALTYARELEHNEPFIEHGISVIEEFQDKTFNQLIIG